MPPTRFPWPARPFRANLCFALPVVLLEGVRMRSCRVPSPRPCSRRRRARRRRRPHRPGRLWRLARRRAGRAAPHYPGRPSSALLDAVDGPIVSPSASSARDAAQGVAGLVVDVFPKGLNTPRVIRAAPNGDSSSPRAARRASRLRADGMNSAPAQSELFAERLQGVFGIDFSRPAPTRVGSMSRAPAGSTRFPLWRRRSAGVGRARNRSGEIAGRRLPLDA